MRTLLRQMLFAFLMVLPSALIAGPSEAAKQQVADRREGLEGLNSQLRLLRDRNAPIDEKTEDRARRALTALHAALSSKDRHIRDEAINDILNMNYGGFPDDDVIKAILPLVQAPETEMEPIRLQGLLIYHLGRIYGSNAAVAAPSLMKFMRDPKVHEYLRGQAIEALGQIGRGKPEVLRGLLAIARDPATDANLMRRVVFILAANGERSEEVKTLLTRLSEREHNHDAFLSLGIVSMDESPKPLEHYLEVIRTLDKRPLGEVAAAFLHVQRYGNPEARFRERLLYAVPPKEKRIEASAVLARPVLIHVVKERSELFSRLALAVLEAIGPGSSKDAAEVIVTAAFKPDHTEALYVLAQFDATDAAAVPVFRDGFKASLKQASWVRNVEFARLLARYGRNAASAVPAMIDAIKTARITENTTDAYFEMYSEYLATLAAVGAGSLEAQQAVLEQLGPESDTMAKSGKAVQHYRAELLKALAGVGLPRDGKPRMTAIQQMAAGVLMDFDIVFLGATEIVRRHAGELTQEESTNLVPMLTRVLEPSFTFRDAEGVMKLPPKDRFQQLSREEMLQAVKALAALGPKAKDGVPALQALADREPEKSVSGYLPPPPINAVIKEAQAAVKAIGGK